MDVLWVRKSRSIESFRFWRSLTILVSKTAFTIESATFSFGDEVSD